MVLTEAQELLVALVSRDQLDHKANQVHQDFQAALEAQDLLDLLAVPDPKANQELQASLVDQAKLDLLEGQDLKEARVPLASQEHPADQDLQDLLAQLELLELRRQFKTRPTKLLFTTQNQLSSNLTTNQLKRRSGQRRLSRLGRLPFNPHFNSRSNPHTDDDNKFYPLHSTRLRVESNVQKS